MLSSFSLSSITASRTKPAARASAPTDSRVSRRASSSECASGFGSAMATTPHGFRLGSKLRSRGTGASTWW